MKQGFRNSVAVIPNMGDGDYEEAFGRCDYTPVPFLLPRFLSQGLPAHMNTSVNAVKKASGTRGQTCPTGVAQPL